MSARKKNIDKPAHPAHLNIVGAHETRDRRINAPSQTSQEKRSTHEYPFSSKQRFPDVYTYTHAFPPSKRLEVARASVATPRRPNDGGDGLAVGSAASCCHRPSEEAGDAPDADAPPDEVPPLLALVLVLLLPLPLGKTSVRTMLLGLPRRGNLVAAMPGPEIRFSKNASRS